MIKTETGLMEIIKQNITKIRSRVSRYAEESAANNQGMVTEQELNDCIYRAIQKSSPFVAGKIGGNELLVCRWHLKWRLWNSLWMKLPWKRTELLATGAGIFPKNTESYDKFARQYIAALGEIDYLGMWHNEGEMKLVSTFAPEAKIGRVHGLVPF